MIAREDQGDLAILRLAHGKVSALDAELCDAIVSAVTDVAAGRWKALILTGTGPAFSAGVDLFRVLDGRASYLQVFLPRLEAMLRKLLTFEKPLVAAINGHAIAGGCIIAATCDHRVMASGAARIGVPELVVGVPFPPLPLAILAERVNPAALRRLIYTGENVLAEEALALGLIDEIAAPAAVIERAVAAAERLARIPSQTFALTRRELATPVLDRVRAMAHVDVAVNEVWSSQEVFDTIRAYLDRTIGKKS